MVEKMQQHKKFLTYVWVGGVFSITNIMLLYLFIDIFRIPTIISSTIIVLSLFLAKYVVYKMTGFTG